MVSNSRELASNLDYRLLIIGDMQVGVLLQGPNAEIIWSPAARENSPTCAPEKPTSHQSWMTLLYPPGGGGGRVVNFSVVASLMGTG